MVEKGYIFIACIWDNKSITGMWNKVLWNNLPISNNILYIADFLDNNSNTIMPYEVFCNKYNISCLDFPQNSYSNIKMAIRDYRTYTINTSKYTSFYEKTILAHIISGINSDKHMKGKQICDLLCFFKDPNMLIPLKMWSRDLNTISIDWVSVFIKLHFDNCNNFKLIQFQYKLIM